MTTVRPTHVEAADYVRALFTSSDWTGMEGLVITACADVDDKAVDVFFEYGNGLLNNGTMTVWTQSNGSLYGEW